MLLSGYFVVVHCMIDAFAYMCSIADCLTVLNLCSNVLGDVWLWNDWSAKVTATCAACVGCVPPLPLFAEV